MQPELEWKARDRGFYLQTWLGRYFRLYDSGLAFLNRQTDTDFDCVLIDFKMAPHDGLELLREMRELGVATPAIMITGWESKDIEELARGAGFEDLIYKPMLDDKLVAALDQILAH